MALLKETRKLCYNDAEFSKALLKCKAGEVINVVPQKQQLDLA